MPASVLGALGSELRSHAGLLPAIHALHAAGYRAGEAFFADFSRALDGVGRAPRATEFFASLSTFLERRGWGSLRHEEAHPGIGLLRSADWAEADSAGSPQPVCAFTVGLLSHLLTRVAGDPVAVLEVECRAAGAGACTFAFGSGGSIHQLYGLLLEGESVNRALARL